MLVKDMSDESLIIELEENKEQFDDHKQKFIESVAEFFYKNKFITESQRDYLEIYYKELKDESWLMNDFD